MRPRTYEFDWNLFDDTAVFIVANIWGGFTPATLESPAEGPEIEVTIYKAREGMEGPPLIDITDDCTFEFIDEMKEKALELDDEHWEQVREERGR